MLDAPGTWHLRCGSDIRDKLGDAGFIGEFHEHSTPYIIIACHDTPPHDAATLTRAAESGHVVIWSEGDAYDQLVLIRLLAHFARHSRPARLELINVRDYEVEPKFIGLGQLSPAALREVWEWRTLAGDDQLALGLRAWLALCNDDPRPLAAIVREGTPALPLLGPALHRHLRELPSIENGLSFTEQMALTLLAEKPASLNQLFLRVQYVVDPLPGQGDLQFRDRVLAMHGHLFTAPAAVTWADLLTITDLGRRVLAGEVDFRSLRPGSRWVGGVNVGAPGVLDWRWNESSRGVETA